MRHVIAGLAVVYGVLLFLLQALREKNGSVWNRSVVGCYTSFTGCFGVRYRERTWSIEILRCFLDCAVQQRWNERVAVTEGSWSYGKADGDAVDDAPDARHCAAAHAMRREWSAAAGRAGDLAVVFIAVACVAYRVTEFAGMPTTVAGAGAGSAWRCFRGIKPRSEPRSQSPGDDSAESRQGSSPSPWNRPPS